MSHGTNPTLHKIKFDDMYAPRSVLTSQLPPTLGLSHRRGWNFISPQGLLDHKPNPRPTSRPDTSRGGTGPKSSVRSKWHLSSALAMRPGPAHGTPCNLRPGPASINLLAFSSDPIAIQQWNGQQLPWTRWIRLYFGHPPQYYWETC